MAFVDKTEIIAISGNGGNGCVSFFRRKFRPKEGPSGGNGGTGGSVIIIGTPKLNSLEKVHILKTFTAENGKKGEPGLKKGSDGKDITIIVPYGTIISNSDTGKTLGEIIDKDSVFVAAKGGIGGHGNNYFKNSINRAPDFAEEGKEGEVANLTLELKIIADIGLVGLPNAGKSSLLRLLTKANTKIAAYPFSTLSPCLGTLVIGKDRATIADIPGLIENAHKGQGLGINFLKHIERTKIIFHLVDLTTADSDGIIESYKIIRQELKEFSKTLLIKPEVVVFNKIDLVSAAQHTHLKETVLPYFRKKKIKFFVVSAKEGTGKNLLLNFIQNKI